MGFFAKPVVRIVIGVFTMLGALGDILIAGNEAKQQKETKEN